MLHIKRSGLNGTKTSVEGFRGDRANRDDSPTFGEAAGPELPYLRAIQVRALSGLLGASLQDETPGAEVIEEFSLARFAAVKSVL
jgi:hypothetical protein